MSGFFQGPSLMIHVFIVALVLGFTGHFIIDLMPTRAQGFVLILALAVLYFTLALIWASRHMLSGSRANSDRFRQDDSSDEKR